MLTYVHISITGKGWVYFERHMCASADWLYWDSWRPFVFIPSTATSVTQTVQHHPMKPTPCTAWI